jgi:hypothetical protein
LTFTQKFTGSSETYLDYDFKKRDKRRGGIFLDKKIAKENLLLLKKICDSVQLNFVILYGTLLGAIREKDFIGHDTDTDVGIFVGDEDKLLMAKDMLISNGFSLIRTSRFNSVISFMRKDEYIDIYVFSIVKKLFKKSYSSEDGKVDFNLLSTLSTINFLGETFYAPSNPIMFLVKSYGGGWINPNKEEGCISMGSKNLFYRIKRRLTQSIANYKLNKTFTLKR